MPFLVVEYEFNPPITEERLSEMKAKIAPCASIRNIRGIRTIISEDGTRGFCEIEAPDAETVREAYRSARVPFRSVWPARLFEPRPAPSG